MLLRKVLKVCSPELAGCLLSTMPEETIRKVVSLTKKLSQVGAEVQAAGRYWPPCTAKLDSLPTAHTLVLAEIVHLVQQENFFLLHLHQTRFNIILSGKWKNLKGSSLLFVLFCFTLFFETRCHYIVQTRLEHTAILFSSLLRAGIPGTCYHAHFLLLNWLPRVFLTATESSLTQWYQL